MTRNSSTQVIRGRRLRTAVTLLGAAAFLLTGLPSAAGGAPATSGALGATSASAAPAAAGSLGVFAIDNDHHTVVFIPAAGGTPRPVMSGVTDPTQIAASRAGSVFIVDGTRLVKVNPHGLVRTLRSGMAPGAQIAVDDNNWIFVHDGSLLVKYSPVDGSSATPVGSGDPNAFLTIDAAGNASLTGTDPANYLTTVITTYPVRGGRPTVRLLVSGDDNGADFDGPSGVVEARDGTIYLQTEESGASGATDVYRVPTGPAGRAPAYETMQWYSEYAYNVDADSRFYLLQNRYWCAQPSRDENGCVDDYGVDFVQRYTAAGAGPTKTAVTQVELPVGGISVASSGAIYAAVLVSRSAGPTNSIAIPRMLRIDAAGGAPVVLAKGHFSMPVAENFRWYAG